MVALSPASTSALWRLWRNDFNPYNLRDVVLRARVVVGVVDGRRLAVGVQLPEVRPHAVDVRVV